MGRNQSKFWNKALSPAIGICASNATVVVDFFLGQTVVRVEGVHTAKRELDSLSRRRKTTPTAEVSTAYRG
jgi:hypothetical protein